MKRDRKFKVYTGDNTPLIRYVGDDERLGEFIEKAKRTKGESEIDVSEEEMEDLLQNIQVGLVEETGEPQMVVIPVEQYEAIKKHHGMSNGKGPQKTNGQHGGHGTPGAPAPDGD